MFGILVLIFIVVYVIRMFILNSIDDIQGRANLKNERLNTYIDHNGLNRDLITNKYRAVIRDYKGDIHLKGKDIGDINISQQDRDKEYLKYKQLIEQGKNLNRTTVYWKPSPDYDTSKQLNILGDRYKDILTGRILVVRVHEYKNFYVTVDTMEVVRYTDFQKETMKRNNMYSEEKEMKDVMEFQNHINQKRTDSNFIGDPTKGIGSFNVSRLKDYWKPEKGVY